MIIEFEAEQGYQSVLSADRCNKSRLKAGISRDSPPTGKLREQYGVNTEFFVANMAAEDMEGGDLEYVEWAGEAQLLTSLEQELAELEKARFELPGLS